MKKAIKLSFLFLLIFGFSVPVIFAQNQEYDFQLNQNKSLDKFFQDELSNPNTDTNNNSDQMSGGITITASQVPSIIEKIARWLYTIVLALSTIFGLYAAFLYLIGNSKDLEKAKKQLIYAFVGVFIAIIAFSIEAIIRGVIR